LRRTSDATSPGAEEAEPGAENESCSDAQAPDLALAERLLGATFEHALKSKFHRLRLTGRENAASTSAWHLLPEMSREQLETCMGDIVLDAGTLREYVHTGGSTGRPLVFPKTLAEETFIRDFFSRADTGRELELVRGIRFTTPYHGHETPVPVPAWFHKISVFDRGGFAFARKLLSTPWDAPGIASDCTVIAGAERFVRAFTLDCEAAGLDGTSTQVAFLLPNGQYISATWRRRYAEYWGAVVVDRFALTEAFGGATEDPATGWYLFDPCCFPEVVALDTRRRISEGLGELVLTPLYPFQQGLPLIRYATGDLVAVTSRHPRSAGHPAIRPLGRLSHAILPDGQGMPLVPAAVGAEVIDEMPDVCRTPLYRDARHLVARQGLGHAVYHMARESDNERAIIRFHVKLEPDSRMDVARADAVRERFHLHYRRIVGDHLPDHVSIDVRFGPPPSQDLISHAP
jgi:hypothetical protein